MRRVVVWLTPAIAAGVIAAASIMAPAAQAGKGLKPLVPGGHARPASVTANGVLLLGTRLTNALPFYTTTGGVFNPVDSATTLKCPSTAASCSIDATMAVELLDSSGLSGNQFAIALAIDGTVVSGNYTDVAPLDGYFRTYTTHQAFPAVVGPGPHTVQTMIYTTDPIFLAYAFSSYHIYKP